MSDFNLRNFVEAFNVFSRRVRLIWALCAVILIMFGLDLSSILSPDLNGSLTEPIWQLTAVPSPNSQVQGQNGVLGEANTASMKLAQAATAKPQGQVKALTTVILPIIYLESALAITGTWIDSGSYGSRYYAPNSPIGLGSWMGYVSGDPFFIKYFYKNASAVFDLTALPAGQTVIDAAVVFSLSCSGSRTTSIAPYNGDGLTDPRSFARIDWRYFAAGGIPVGTATSCTPGEVSLGGVGPAQIQTAKSLINRYSLGFSGSTGALVGFAAISSPQLKVTYGNREVDLKANGVDGPITVAGGSNVNFSWTSLGFTSCSYGASPAWYTNGWEIGKSVPSAGSTSTKIYYENVTYRINCRDLGSGATGADQVTVNVTP